MLNLVTLKQTESIKVKSVAKIFLINKLSATIIIPAESARRKGLDHPSHVIIEEVSEGILIRKLNLD
jgi:hypothetical protein